MLRMGLPAEPAALRACLIVEPRQVVALSVLPADDPDRAAAECARCGVPGDLLRRHGATAWQTHRRANVIVLDVPAERQAELAADLTQAGFAARPPKPVYPCSGG